MTAPPSYRQLAESNIDRAVQELRALPDGVHPSPVVAAAAAQTQAIATIALVQALLEIGDVLREAAQDKGPADA